MVTGLLARGRYVLAGDPAIAPLLNGGAVYAEDGEIREIGKAAELERRYPNAKVVGDDRHVVLPGLVNAHNHARGATWLQRGNADEPLDLWLLAFRFALGPDPALDARFAALRLLRSGVTTVLVSSYVPPGERMEAIVRATLDGLLSTGIRVAFAVGLMDRSAWDDPDFRAALPPPLTAELDRRLGPASPTQTRATFELLDRLRAETSRPPGRRLTLLLGPVSPHWCSDELLTEVKRLSAATGAAVHTHALETRSQAESARRRHGRSLLEHLARVGFLGPRVSLAHCVALSDGDVDALRDTGATVVHNPSSNLRLWSGIADVPRLLERGVAVALGTDSQGLRDDDDLLAEIGLASALHRGSTDRVALGSRGALALATTGSARAAGLAGTVGEIRVGGAADLTLIDLEALAWPAIVDEADPIDLVVGRGTATHVATVVVGGRVVVDEGRPLLADPAETARALRDSLASSSTPAELRAFVREVKPYVARGRAALATDTVGR